MHSLQGVLAPPQGCLHTVTRSDEHAVDALATAAARGYRAAFPDAELVEFTNRGASYLFDLTGGHGDDRQPRVIAGWGFSQAAPSPRNKSRQAGFPLPAAIAGRGFERGHLLAHASGGGLDENLFPQAAHVNQGRSPAGRLYRRLERLAAGHPGALLFHRLIYGDGTDVPDLTVRMRLCPAPTVLTHDLTDFGSSTGSVGRFGAGHMHSPVVAV